MRARGQYKKVGRGCAALGWQILIILVFYGRRQKVGCRSKGDTAWPTTADLLQPPLSSPCFQNPLLPAFAQTEPSLPSNLVIITSFPPATHPKASVHPFSEPWLRPATYPPASRPHLTRSLSVGPMSSLHLRMAPGATSSMAQMRPADMKSVRRS